MNLKRVAKRLPDRAPRERAGHTPQLMSVWVAAAAAIIVAGGLGWGLYEFVKVSPAVLGAAPLKYQEPLKIATSHQPDPGPERDWLIDHVALPKGPAID